MDTVGAPIDYPIGTDRLRVSGGSFFQVNRLLLRKLVATALRGVRGRQALDLYCGVGLLTLPLARRFDGVVGVDRSATSIRDLRFNAMRARLGIQAVRADVVQFLEGFRGRPDFAVADPPRAGLGANAVAEILRISPSALCLVSCDPATLARDVRMLAAGGYRVVRLTLVDLFPRTYHIETVACLER